MGNNYQAKICPQCRMQIHIKAKKCPYCNSAVGLSLFRIIKNIIIFIIVIFAIFFVFSLFSNSGNNDVSTNSGKLEVIGDVNVRTNSAINGVEIIGKVVNNSDKKYSYVQIVIGLYNKSGEKVGVATTNTLNLSSGDVWKFSAVTIAKEVSDVKLEELSGH